MLLKPLDLEEVSSILLKSVAHLEEIRKSRQDIDKLKKLSLESLPILQKTFLRSLLDGGCTMDEIEILDKLSYLRSDITGRYYCVAIISPQLLSLPKPEIDLKLIAVSHTSNELINAAGFKFLSMFDTLNNIVFVLSWDDNSGANRIDDVFCNIHNKLLFYYNLSVYTSIGGVVQSIKNASESMTEAKEAFDYKHLFAQNNVVNIKNVIRIFNKPTASFRRNKSDILCSFKDGNIDKLSTHLVELVTNAATTFSGNIEILQRLFIELTVLILHTASDIGINTAQYFEQRDPYRQVMQMTNVKEMIDWLSKLAKNLILAIKENKNNKTAKLIAIAKQYIDDNLSDVSLGLASVSEHVELSSVYFCQLFHSETGIRLNEYINSIRIEHAKELLKDPLLKIYKISEMSGYTNPKYFNYVFKKFTGQSPNKFRQYL